jgi:DNA polymerase III epsilon subunit-like protein
MSDLEIKGFELKGEVTRYVSVDVEATGPIPGDYSLLSIGACLVTNPNVKFYVEIQMLNDNITDWPAIHLSDLIHRVCSAPGLTPKYAMEKFAGWLAENVKGKPIFVGFNVVFDFKFVDWYFHHFLGDNPFGINALDIKGLFMGKFGRPWYETNKGDIKKVLGITTPHTHNALEDAIEQAEICRIVLVS